MWEMGRATMALSLEEKMRYEQGDRGQSFGFVSSYQITTSLYICQLICSYKAAGANNVDEYGNLDTVEFIK